MNCLHLAARRLPRALTTSHTRCAVVVGSRSRSHAARALGPPVAPQEPLTFRTPCGCWFSHDAGPEMTAVEIKRAVDEISEMFTEAMELMNDARSSAGTVYFSEDVEDTQLQVSETLKAYRNLLDRLTQAQRTSVIQSVGLKMEELKAQLSLIEELARE